MSERLDLLVSENESSSSGSLSSTRQLSDNEGEQYQEQPNVSSQYPQQIRQEKYQHPLSSEDEEDENETANNQEEEFNKSESPKTGTADIKNEMLKSKITTSASIVLAKLPPDSNKAIRKFTQETNEKITIRCQPIGSAPQLTPTVFKISDTQPFATLIKFINKKLRKKLPNKEDVIYCYVNNSFAPSPDEVIGNLHKHFATNNELVVSYCNVVAFG